MEDWGLSPFFEEAFRPHAEEGRLLGRVLRSRGRSIDAMTEWDELELHVGHSVEELAVGDWVVCQPVGARVLARLPRRTVIARRRPGRAAREQVICANVDVALILTGLDDDFSVRRIERYLAVASSGGAQAVLVMTKADLCDDLEGRLAEVAHVAGRRPVVVTCAPRGEGVEAIRSHLGPGKTVVLLGSSGVGKSTLLNALLGESRAETGETLEDGRGKHTTTHRELFLVPGGGIMVDVPGLREVGVGDAAGVEDVFEEVAELAAACRFADCQHEEEPGCAVVAAHEAGELAADRFEAYRSLRKEALSHARRASEHERRRHEKAHPAVRLRHQRRREDND